MANKIDTKQEKRFHIELLTQMLTLATSGFGLVAALAWNEAIQAFVKQFIESRIPGSGIFYKFIYAILITVMAVFITYQLSYLAIKFQRKR